MSLGRWSERRYLHAYTLPDLGAAIVVGTGPATRGGAPTGGSDQEPVDSLDVSASKSGGSGRARIVPCVALAVVPRSSVAARAARSRSGGRTPAGWRPGDESRGSVSTSRTGGTCSTSPTFAASIERSFVGSPARARAHVRGYSHRARTCSSPRGASRGPQGTCAPGVERVMPSTKRAGRAARGTRRCGSASVAAHAARRPRPSRAARGTPSPWSGGRRAVALRSACGT